MRSILVAENLKASVAPTHVSLCKIFHSLETDGQFENQAFKKLHGPEEVSGFLCLVELFEKVSCASLVLSSLIIVLIIAATLFISFNKGAKLGAL